MDNKVRSLTSLLEILGLVQVNRRSGSNALNLMVQQALKEYQEGIARLDRSWKCHERGTCFAIKAHNKKWYKKDYFCNDGLYGSECKYCIKYVCVGSGLVIAGEKASVPCSIE
jgi:hypothetical protein